MQRNQLVSEPLTLNATWGYNGSRVAFLYRFWITKIFQTSILFETNKFHHGGAPCSGGPGAIAPFAPPLIRPCLNHDVVVNIIQKMFELKKVKGA